MPDDDRLPLRLAIAVGRINRRIRADDGSLSHAQLSALASIVGDGPLRPGDLARAEAVAAPTMTRVIAELEGRGLVERSPDPADGRAWALTATDAGRDAVTLARHQRAEHVEALMAGLDDAQRESIRQAIDALEAAASHPGPPRAPR